MWRSQEKKKKLYQYRKHGDERQIPQEEQLDHVKCWKTSVIILKQKNYTLIIFFFKSPNTKTVRTNKINSTFSGIPDVKILLHFRYQEKKNQCICNIGKYKETKPYPHFANSVQLPVWKSISPLVLLRQHETTRLFLLSSYFAVKYGCEFHTLVLIADARSAKDGRAQWRLSTDRVHLCW